MTASKVPSADIAMVSSAAMERRAMNLASPVGFISSLMNLPILRAASSDRVRIAPGLVADADPVLIRIALENLSSNAVKYISKIARAAIEFDTCEVNGETLFFVRDNGVGFDMEGAKRLFEPFQRLHSTADYDGLGIGLATVQQIVARHGGRVWARSATGAGATFFFTLAPAA